MVEWFLFVCLFLNYRNRNELEQYPNCGPLMAVLGVTQGVIVSDLQDPKVFPAVTLTETNWGSLESFLPLSRVVSYLSCRSWLKSGLGWHWLAS